jgi:ankyrin repeat protein
LHDYQDGVAEAAERLLVEGGIGADGTAKLADAQRVIAREYGFASWTRLKKRVEEIALEKGDPLELAREAFRKDDAPGVREILRRYPELKARINEPVPPSDAPVIYHVRSREMLDVLLDAGADINGKTRWWAGGFGLLDCAKPELAAYAIERGATVTPHAAARLGMIDKLREIIERDPESVYSRGGDGQTPLHFASTVEITEYLLDHGADIDALDVDHESTAAQYMVQSRPEVARYLVQRGCKTDVLMAAALGDIALAKRILERDPESIRMRVSTDYFPMVRPKGGGTIYQWTLGWYVSACQVAKKFGHGELFTFLMERCPADEKLLNACWLGDEALVKALLAAEPNLAARLSGTRRWVLADAARNNNLAAVRLMLMAGVPADSYSQQHHAMPLHWAGFHGNVDMLRLFLRHKPPIEDAENEFKSTPLRWTIYGSENGWNQEKGDYAAAIEVLIEAGAKLPEKLEGSPAAKEALRRYGLGG